MRFGGFSGVWGWRPSSAWSVCWPGPRGAAGTRESPNTGTTDAVQVRNYNCSTRACWGYDARRCRGVSTQRRCYSLHIREIAVGGVTAPHSPAYCASAPVCRRLACSRPEGPRGSSTLCGCYSIRVLGRVRGREEGTHASQTAHDDPAGVSCGWCAPTWWCPGSRPPPAPHPPGGAPQRL